MEGGNLKFSSFLANALNGSFSLFLCFQISFSFLFFLLLVPTNYLTGVFRPLFSFLSFILLYFIALHLLSRLFLFAMPSFDTHCEGNAYMVVMAVWPFKNVFMQAPHAQWSCSTYWKNLARHHSFGMESGILVLFFLFQNFFRLVPVLFSLFLFLRI